MCVFCFCFKYKVDILLFVFSEDPPRNRRKENNNPFKGSICGCSSKSGKNRKKTLKKNQTGGVKI